MNRVDMMTKSRDSVSVYFIYYTRMAASSKVVCLFEGEDQKYYAIRIDLLSNELNWKGVDCGGKKNVLELLDTLRKHNDYKNKKTYAFVDQDFDDPLTRQTKGSVIYETPTYSVENFYCTDECINKILDIEYKFNNNPQKPNLQQITFEHYLLLKKQFHNAMRPLNYWIKAHRRKESTDPGVSKLNLKNFNLNKYLNIDITQINCLIKSEFIPSLFPECYPLSYCEIAFNSNLFPLENQELMFRGKYEIEFVRGFLQRLKVESNNTASPFYNPGVNSSKLQLSKENILSELSQYATTPECLKKFISGMVA